MGNPGAGEGPVQDGGLDFEEPVVGKVLTGQEVDLRPHHEVPCELRPPEVGGQSVDTQPPTAYGKPPRGSMAPNSNKKLNTTPELMGVEIFM